MIPYTWLWFWGFLWFIELPPPQVDKQILGVSWVAPARPVGDSTLQSVHAVGATAITLMPYAFLPPESSTLQFHTDSSAGLGHIWWGETPEGVRACIQMAHDQQLAVWLKPHVWLKNGAFTGTYVAQDWVAFEQSFRAYFLLYAQIGTQMKVEGMCIGTEWAAFVKARPAFWKKLIQEIRQVYPGKLTYAENWDAVADFPHWPDLDFIGVDAYFPLSSKQNPTREQLLAGWKKPMKQLTSLAQTHQRPILFTEFGYTDAEFSAHEPWKETEHPESPALQALAHDVLLTLFLNEPWFAGGFVWKWFPIPPRRGRDRFSPQGKPAEQIIQKHYSGKSRRTS